MEYSTMEGFNCCCFPGTQGSSKFSGQVLHRQRTGIWAGNYFTCHTTLHLACPEWEYPLWHWYEGELCVQMFIPIIYRGYQKHVHILRHYVLQVELR